MFQSDSCFPKHSISPCLQSEWSLSWSPFAVLARVVRLLYKILQACCEKQSSFAFFSFGVPHLASRVFLLVSFLIKRTIQFFSFKLSCCFHFRIALKTIQKQTSPSCTFFSTACFERGSQSVFYGWFQAGFKHTTSPVHKHLNPELVVGIQCTSARL